MGDFGSAPKALVKAFCLRKGISPMVSGWMGGWVGGSPIPTPPCVGVGHLWVSGFAKILWWVGPSNHPPPPPPPVRLAGTRYGGGMDERRPWGAAHTIRPAKARGVAALPYRSLGPSSLDAALGGACRAAGNWTVARAVRDGSPHQNKDCPGPWGSGRPTVSPPRSCPSAHPPRP